MQAPTSARHGAPRPHHGRLRGTWHQGCRRLVLLAAVFVFTMPGHAGCQIPDSLTNLKVLPANIERDSLVMLMRSFTFATGLACEGCHVMGEGGSFEGAKFHLDDKLPKRQARVMLEMVNLLNEEILPGLPGRAEPALRVECKTCHRGIRRPFLLRTELRSLIDKEGVDAAIRRYRELHDTAMLDGTYDFGVWEMNELGRELERDGRLEDAAAMLELNEEFHPRDASIPHDLGLIYERLGDREKAIAAFRRALGLNPGDSRSLEHLRSLVPAG